MSDRVFANRILNMKKIKYIGLDMDHTLIRYHTEAFESLVFNLVLDKLIQDQQYPNDILQFKFNMQDAIRGLVIDSENGNILKLNRYGAIRHSQHGTQAMSFQEQQAFYKSTYVDLNDPNYMAIDTSFSIAFCVLYMQLVSLKDKNSQKLPSYATMAQDVLHAVDKVHANGQLKEKILNDLARFVIIDKPLVEGLQTFIRQGKKIFILTNSEYGYTNALLNYAITPFLPHGQSWRDLFEYVIVYANKPRFFYDNLRFLSVDPNTGHLSNLFGPVLPGIYQGGNATTFTQQLNLSGDDILYIGDHIYGDIVRLKKHCNWRTALVVDELGQEIDGQHHALPIEQKIIELTHQKKQLEHKKMISTAPDIIATVEAEHITLDKQLTLLLKQQETFFNPLWGRIFRAGAEESYFAYQVDRYACIYMEKLVDLFQCSPSSYFRAHRRTLAHDECSMV